MLRSSRNRYGGVVSGTEATEEVTGLRQHPPSPSQLFQTGCFI